MELIATLNQCMAEEDKKLEAIKVIHLETTTELAIMRVTHEQCTENL